MIGKFELFLTTTSESFVMSITHDTTFSSLRDLINANLAELVYLPNDLVMMVDEEGLLKANCVINNRASSIADRLIVGKAIVIHKDDLESLEYK
jgi:hypothetical protein